MCECYVSMCVVLLHRSLVTMCVNAYVIVLASRWNKYHFFLFLFHFSFVDFVVVAIVAVYLHANEDKFHVKYIFLEALFLIATHDVHSIELCSRAFVNGLTMYSCVHLATANNFCFCCGVKFGLLWPSGRRAPHIVQTVHTVQCHGTENVEKYCVIYWTIGCR